MKKTLHSCHHLRVLIDTWWNVNYPNRHNAEISSNVLIDTWWNVNQHQCVTRQWQHSVLIDTWWNVNPKRWVF